MDGRGLSRASERWPGLEPRAPEIEFGVTVGRLAIRTREAVEVVDLTARIEALRGGRGARGRLGERPEPAHHRRDRA